MGNKAQGFMLFFLLIGTGASSTNGVDVIGADIPQVSSIQHPVRIVHAKELLGKQYKESALVELEGSTKMENFIFHHILESLGEDFKNQAMPLAKAVIEESG